MKLTEAEELELLELEEQDVSSQQPQAQTTVVPEERGMIGKAWDALAVPEAMSREGLGTMAGFVPKPEPTGNLPMDVLKGAPRVAADTIAEAAPGFVSRGSILTAGAAKLASGVAPLVRMAGRGVAAQAESLTGSVPGSLSAAFKDASLIFSKGKQSASPLYEAGKTGGKVATELQNVPLKEELLDIANKLADQGKLPPETALEGRKIVGKLLKKGGGKYTEDFLRKLQGKFDTIAKSNPSIAEGDVAYKRGLMGQSLRNLLPQNKYGGTSAFKTAIMAGMSHMGVPGVMGVAAMSPAASGLASTVAGLASRAVSPIITNPGALVTTYNIYSQYIDRVIEKKQNQGGM